MTETTVIGVVGVVMGPVVVEVEVDLAVVVEVEGVVLKLEEVLLLKPQPPA